MGRHQETCQQEVGIHGRRTTVFPEWSGGEAKNSSDNGLNADDSQIPKMAKEIQENQKLVAKTRRWRTNK